MNAVSLAVSLALASPGAVVEVEPAPEAIPAPEAGRSMILTGSILTALSVGAYAVMAAGLVMGRQVEDGLTSLSGRDDIERRREQLRRGGIANGLAIGGGVSAAAFLAAGVTLIVVGRRRGRAALGVLPTRKGMGLTWSVRF